MAESKLVQLNFENNSYSVYTINNIDVFSILSLGCILISDLVVTNLHAFTSRYDSTLFSNIFFTLNVFLHE